MEERGWAVFPELGEAVTMRAHTVTSALGGVRLIPVAFLIGLSCVACVCAAVLR